MWLRDALPYAITDDHQSKPIGRVMLFGYESSLLASNTFQGLADLKRSFGSSMSDLVDGLNFRPIIIIAHSFGGLIAKEALIQLSRSSNEKHRSAFEAVRGLLFFGVPHDGMNIGSLRAIVGDRPNRPLLESIGDTVDFSEQSRAFEEAIKRKSQLEIFCLYETVESPTATMKSGKWKMDGPTQILVSRTSARSCGRAEYVDDYTYPIHRTHSEMVKFGGPFDEGYVYAVNRIKDIIRLALSRSQGPFQPQLSKNELDCLHSLSFEQMEDRANGIGEVFGKTCEWLLEHKTYARWAAACPSEGILCIKGKPGSGKSTLLKHAFERKKKASSLSGGNLVLSFFFYGLGVGLQKTPLGLFQSLLHQILWQVPTALGDLVAEFEQKRKLYGTRDWRWQENELRSYIISSLPKVSETHSIWLYIDALDECGKDNAINLLEWLSNTSISQYCHVCVTCRHYPILRKVCKFDICPERENAEDISTYVDGRLSTVKELATSEIPDLIKKRASGVFMWAYIVVRETLNLDLGGKSLKEIQQEINVVPEELDGLYSELIEGLKKNQTSLRLMQWICAATRPLSLDELRWAMVVEPNDRSCRDCENKNSFISDNGRMERRVQDLSSGLVEVALNDKRSLTKYYTPPPFHGGAVRFIHQSVKDFFLEKGLSALDGHSQSTNMVLRNAHLQLSRTCIRYLAMEDIHQFTSSEEIDLDKLDKLAIRDSTLADWYRTQNPGKSTRYVLDNMHNMLHTSNTESDWLRNPEPTLNHEAESLGCALESIANWERSGQIVQGHEDHFMYERYHIRRTMEGLDLRDNLETRFPFLRYSTISWVAHTNRVKEYRSQGDLKDDAKDGPGCDFLTLFCWPSNHVIDLWTKFYGILNDVSYDYGPHRPRKGVRLVHILAKNQILGLLQLVLGKPCPIAIDSNHRCGAIVQFSKEGLAEVHAKDATGETPLWYAVFNGQKIAFQLLLDHGAEIDSARYDGDTPLLHAISSGEKETTRLLLDSGANLRLRSSGGRTPLLHAAQYGDIHIVRASLEKGANVDMQDQFRLTPLAAAAEAGHEDIVRLLLETGAKIDIRGSCGWTSLTQAVRGEKEAIAQLLLNNGADINTRDDQGLTPLLWATKFGYGAIFQLLLNNGADIKTRDDQGLTPLLWATKFGYGAIFQLLLNNGADISTRDDQGLTPLSWATKVGHEAIFQLLLNNGADVNNQDDKGLTPLSWAAKKGREVFVQLLLHNGADVNIQNREGLTPLSLAAESGYEAIAQLLLENGAKIPTWNQAGLTPLFWAVSVRCKPIVQPLLESGAEVNSEDGRGWTPLMWASKNNDKAMIKLLRQHGAEWPFFRKTSAKSTLVDRVHT